MYLMNRQIAPSTKPIHLGGVTIAIKTMILKMTQVRFGTCCVLHPLSQMRCTSEHRQAWERPESNMACHWQRIPLCCFPKAQMLAAWVGVLGWLSPMVEQSQPAKSTSSASDLLMKACTMSCFRSALSAGFFIKHLFTKS